MTVRAAVFAWAGLAALLALTVALALVPMGQGNLLASFGIALAKAAIILLVYMKLWHGSVLNRFAAAILCLWLAILVGLTFVDYLTRPEIDASEEIDMPAPESGQPIP